MSRTMPGTDSARNLARNTLLVAAAQAIGAGLRVLYVVVAARALGPDLYALLAYAQSWYLAFLPLALAGTGPALVQRIAAARERTDAAVAAALTLRLLTTAVAAGACLGVALIFSADARAPALIAVLLAALAGRALCAFAQQLYIIGDLNRHTLRQEALFRVLEMGSALVLLANGAGVTALVLLHAAVWLVQALVSLAVVARRIAPLRLAWPRGEASGLAALAAPFFVLQLLAEWRIHGPLILYREVAVDAPAFAQFALAMQAMLILSMIPQAWGAAAQPALVRSAAAGNGRDLMLADTVHRLGIAGGAAAGLLGLALGPALFTLVLGSEYAAAGRLVGLTLWCLVPVAAGFAFPLVFTLRGEWRSQILQSAAATMMAAVLVPVLGGRMGAPGAVLGAGLALALPPVVSCLDAVRRGLGSFSGLILRPTLAVIAPLVLYLALEEYGTGLAFTLAAAMLALVLWTLGVVDRRDVARLRRLA